MLFITMSREEHIRTARVPYAQILLQCSAEHDDTDIQFGILEQAFCVDHVCEAVKLLRIRNVTLLRGYCGMCVISKVCTH